ncbi:MAG: 23S rRNA (adenine(1618)-N(6))-methyltransferase RlmF [Crocinitomicaceae bacterium]|nr:23S rRNA (adenine(1618)-N(6))-methyltransferase RlmF [Crocinitomicaceae bacterium]
MAVEKKIHPEIKLELHSRNKHRERYNFKALIGASSELGAFVAKNKFGDESIDFSDPAAVKALNKALLKLHYGIDYWDIPQNYLCPPIPGRADYVHHASELLGSVNNGKVPTGKQIKVLDIGTGASCIFPIVGTIEYGWSFVASDIDKIALESAGRIIANNKSLRGNIELRFQSNPRNIFYGMFQKEEVFDLTICNPPFHASLEESQEASLRKVKNLKGIKVSKPILNFGGQNNELWCEGGELRFVKDMIFQSKQFAESCLWFSTTVSKQSNLKAIYTILKRVEAVEVKTLPMAQGNKTSRVVAWTFLSLEKQQNWVKNRFK